MTSTENSGIAQKEPLSVAAVARRVGGVLVSLIPNSRPISRERPQADEEPRFSFDAFVDEEVPDAHIHSLDEQRKKRGEDAQAGLSLLKPPADQSGSDLHALRKKKSA